MYIPLEWTKGSIWTQPNNKIFNDNTYVCMYIRMHMNTYHICIPDHYSQPSMKSLLQFL